MYRFSFLSKVPFLNWLRDPAAQTPRRQRSRRARLGIEILEDRLAPASFAETSSVITLALTANNETVTIFSKGANLYHLATTNTTNGFVTAGLVTPSSFSTPSGSTSGDLTVNPADTRIAIVDNTFTGGHIIFSDSGANPYAQNFNVNLTNANAGNIDFFGTSTFNNNLFASTTKGTVTVQAGAVVNLDGSGTFPTATLQQTATGTSQRVEIDGTIITIASVTALNIKAFGANIPPGINEAATGVIKTNAATTATFALTGAAGTINVNGGPNDFAGPVVITQSGGGSVTTLDFRNTDPAAALPTLTGLTSLADYTLVTDNASIPLANGANLPNTLQNFAYTSGGDITQTGALSFTNSATFTVLGNNSILLNSVAAGNAIPNVTFSALKGDNTTQVSYLGAASVNIVDATLGLGTFNVTAQGSGNISQINPINENIGGAGSTFTLSPTGTGTTVNLDNNSNDLEGPVTISGGTAAFTTVTLHNSSLLPQFPTFPSSVTSLTIFYLNAPAILPSLGATITFLDIFAAGIFQQPGTTLTLNTASSVASFHSINSIILGNANDFSSASGHGISVFDGGPSPVVVNAIHGLNFGFSPSFLSSGTLTVTAGGAITQSSPITQTVFAGQTANAGQTSFTAAGGNNITLTDPGNQLNGIVDLFTSGAGSASITNSTSLNLGTSVIGTAGNAATFTANVTNGSLTQDPGTTLTIAGGSSLTASTIILGFPTPGTITLDNDGNVFHGAPSPSNSVSVNGSNVTLRASGGPINLGASSVTGSLVVRAGGAITQVGAITGAPTSSLFDAGTAAITLTNAGNVFTGVTSASSVGVSFKGNTTSGSATVSSVSSVAGLSVGQTVTGAGIPANTTILAIGPTTITLSNNATATATGATLTAAAEVQLTATGTLQVGRINLGTGPGIGANALVLTAGTISQASGTTSGITEAPLAGNLVLNSNGTISLNNPANTWSGLVDLNTATSVTGLTLANVGSLNFVGTPAIAGTNTGVNLTSGQTIIIPNRAYTTWTGFSASAKETDVTQNITTTTGAIVFSGTASLGVPATLLTLHSAAGFTFTGDVNVNTTTGGLTLAAVNPVNLNEGTWSEGSSPLTITGSLVTFDIGNGLAPATFNMVSGTISMAGAGSVNVFQFATFEVGDTTTTTTVDTVNLSNGTGSLQFQSGATLSVGLGTTNDQLVDAAGNVSINSSARLTAYSGVTGASASPVLTATAGTVTGFFALTVDTFNSPHVFLMGTDIVVPVYTVSSVSVASGGTVSASGTVTGFEPDGDGYTIKASTGAAAQLTTAVDINGLLDIVVRNASTAVMLAITTTLNLGDGLTQLGGIAVDGPGAASINAPTSDINLGDADPFADILVQGPLAALTIRDFNSAGITPTFLSTIKAGGTNAQATTITGRRFDSVSINLPTVLTSLTLADYNNTVGLDTVTAERFGTITTTGVANTLVKGDFVVSRLTNLDMADSSMPGLGTVKVANKIQGQFDIQRAITSVMALQADYFALGLPGGANNPNGDLTGNITTLSLGVVTNSEIESIGTVSSLTAASVDSSTLQALSFGTIKTTGNATLPAPGDFGNFSNTTLTATGNNAGLGLGTLALAGDANTDTFNLLNGNVGTVTVKREWLSSTLNAGVTTPQGVLVSAVTSSVGTLTAAAFSSLTLNARLLTTLSAVGNLPFGIFGDIGSATVTVQGNATGAPVFAGVGLGTVTAAHDVTSSSFTVINGSLTTFTVGYQMSSTDILLLNNAGILGSVTAGAWSGQLNRGLVAQSIGSITTKGVAAATASSPLLIGNLSGVNILAFVNTGTTVGLGTLSVAGNFILSDNGFLRSDNGIGIFSVVRDVDLASAGDPGLISVRNANTGKIGTITVGRWNTTASGDLVADTIGTMTVTGYTAAEESPTRVNGDFAAGNFFLLNTTKVDATSITVANTMFGPNLLAPGGIGALTVGNQLAGTVNTDNASGTLGAIGTLQAGQIGIFGVSFGTAISATIRAVTIGTLKTVINIPLGADGSMDGSTVTATSTTAAAGIGTVSIASFVTNNAASVTSIFNVPRSVTTFTVGEDVNTGSQIGAGYATGSSIGTFTAAAITNSVLTARSIAKLNVIGKSLTVTNAAVLTGNVSNSIITALGNLSGVGLGIVTIKQKVVNSDFNIAGGNVTSFTVGGMFGSHLLVGAHTAGYDNIVATATAANWDTPVSGVTFNLGSFKTTGLFDKTDVSDTANFRDSFIIAQQLGTVAITGLDPNVPAASETSGGSPTMTFGVAFRGSVGAGPKITVTFSDAGLLTTQMLVAPLTPSSPPATTTPASPFKYVNLGG